MALLNILVGLLATLLPMASPEPLECVWQTRSGKLKPYIEGNITSYNNITSITECQQLCMSQSDYLCHSVNYKSRQCVLLMENLQTASIDSTENTWMCSVRPPCAGMWLPWMATNKTQLSGDNSLASISYTANRVKQCTQYCLIKQNCQSVTVELKNGGMKSCDLRGTLSAGDVEESATHQTFNRPSWYLDNSPSAGKQNLTVSGDLGTAIHILNVTHVLPVSGYLVGWKYKTRADLSEACDSYADVWRPTGGNNFILISKTLLTPDSTTSGIKFQFVQDVLRVQKNDVVGFHVKYNSSINSDKGLPDGCSGNLVSTIFHGSQQPVGSPSYVFTLNVEQRKLNEGIGIRFSRTEPRTAAINIFTAEYLTVHKPVIQYEEGVTKITWRKPTDNPLPLLYRLQCSRVSDFTAELTNCSDLIDGTRHNFIRELKEPNYIRVQVVRSINGQSHEDLTFSQSSEKFCTAHGRPVKVEITPITENSNTDNVTVIVNVTGIELDDVCAQQYQIQVMNDATKEVQNGSLISFNQTINLTLNRGVKYSIQLNLQLLTGHVMMNIVSKTVEYSFPLPIPGQLSSTIGERDGNDMMMSIIIGSAIGGVVLIALVVVIVVCAQSRRKQRQRNMSSITEPQPSGTSAENRDYHQGMCYENVGQFNEAQNVDSTTVYSEPIDIAAQPQSIEGTSSEKKASRHQEMCYENVGQSESNGIPASTAATVPQINSKMRTLSNVEKRQKPKKSSRNVKSHHETSESRRPEPKPRPRVTSAAASKQVERGHAGESLYENVQPISVRYLTECIRREMKKNPDSPFAEEFSRLKQTTQDPESEGIKEYNKAKNRFKNIVPYDDNRVVLPLDSTYESDYINASFIPDGIGNNQRFIACQGPKPETVVDMWRMIISQGSEVIVMITNLIETGKVKCAQYWPDSKLSQHTYDEHIRVTMSLELIFSEYVQRKLSYTYTAGSVQKQGDVDLFHFTHWFDQDVPSTAGLLRFRQKVRSKMNKTSNPVIVHCSAGAGRTGTFIGLDNLVSKSELEKDWSRAEVDVFNCVQKLRQMRPSMIQTSDQYSFLYRVVADAVHTGKTWLYTSEFPKTYHQWKKGAELTEQFDRLASSKSLLRPLRFTTARLPENGSRNSTNILASDTTRAFLPDGDNDYINAVFVNGYYRERAYICTQNPLPGTIKHFWCLVSETNCSVVLYFNQTGETKPFPIQEKGLNVSCSNTDQLSSVLHKHTTSLIIDRRKRSVEIFDLQLDERLPTAAELCELCQILEKHAETKDQIITVVCGNGSQISGLFVTAMNVFLRLKIEQQVDVVLEVKLARRSRPEFIPTQTEFELLYEFVKKYLSSFYTYCNFKM